MKIAILIGVDTYRNGLSNLPACRKDVELMKHILKATDNYKDILCLSNDCTGNNIKTRLSEYVSDLKGNSIDEIFFYFTGHGDFCDNQFYYLLSDFDLLKRKQTSLENTEVDNWLRSLHPKLTIKVVDACHSGVSYVKGDAAINEHLEKSKAGFENCYFMFSSNQDQSSYQDGNLSFFTRSFLKSLFKDDSQKIRYKDIIDYISDEFELGTDQKPFFITQAPFTEIFCLGSSKLRDILNPFRNEIENDHIVSINEPATSESMTLEMIIREDAKQYCDAEYAENILRKIKENIPDYEYPQDILSIYKFDYTFHSHDEYDKLLKENVIGNWLNKNGEAYFAEPIIEDDPYDVDVPDLSAIGMMRGGYRTKTRYRKTIVGYKNTSRLNYNLIRINAEPKFPNAPSFNCTLAIILSKKLILLFDFFTQYRNTNWSERELIPEFRWHYSEKHLADEDAILDSMNNIQQQYGNYILRKLQERFKSMT